MPLRGFHWWEIRPAYACLTRKARAFAMVELLMVIAATIALLGLLAFYLKQASAKRLRIECVNNLKGIGLDCRAFRTETNARPSLPGGSGKASGLPDGNSIDVPGGVWALTNIGNPRMLTCPADKRRSPATNWSAVSRDTISYFLNLEDQETQPQSLLSGDSNLTTNGVSVPSGVLVPPPGTSIGWNRERHVNAGNVALGDGSVQ